MYHKEMMKQMIQLNKTVFENTLSSMAILQDQMEKATNTFLEQAAWLPAEGKKVIEEWVKACKNGRESYKNAVDESFKRVEAFFTE
ncbi:MAG: hypothetical protein ABSG91_05745 [Syntrophobacteraceae bacterium]|jgi:hypothetical protein